MSRTELRVAAVRASIFMLLLLGLLPAAVRADVEIVPAAVSASTHDGNTPANAVDGNLATRWSANGDGQWLRLDLGGPRTVSQVGIGVYRGNERSNEFDLQVSADGTTWTPVLTRVRTSGTTLAEEMFAVGQTARYVRYVGHGSNDATKGSWNSVTELSAFEPDGGPTATPTPTPTPAPTSTPTATPRATATPTPTPTAGGGTIYFENNGTKTTWPNYPQNPQNKGRIDDVTSPAYKGSTAIRFEQTYVRNPPERFHSEVTIQHIQNNGQDRYYGMAMYLPTTWHNESVKDVFQQWGAENPGGPWLIMHIDQDRINGGHPRTFGNTNFGAITKGVWHRVVSRLRMQNNVPFEFWVDGTKRASPNCTCSVTGGSVRYSAGIYIAYWHDRYASGLPAGSQTVRYLYQDHYRITSSLATADPANW